MNKKEEKLPVDEADKNKFWTLGLLGKNSAKSLLNVVYFYNEKLFGLRASEHRNVSLEKFEIGDNYIRFEENLSKTFHRVLLDLKYEPCVVKHVTKSAKSMTPVSLICIICILVLLRFLGKEWKLSILNQMQKYLHSINVLWV